MSNIVFLLEEPSMAKLLESLLPRILGGTSFQLIPHRGKSDLQASLPRKLRGWGVPGTKFVVVHDQDSHDCKVLKENLKTLCNEGHRPDTLIRIVCHELESWFLGDLAAVENATGISGLSKMQANKKYREPDRLSNASNELEKLITGYSKISGAELIAPFLTIESNSSISFRCFVDGVRRLATQRSE